MNEAEYRMEIMEIEEGVIRRGRTCLLYTSDAADE